MVAKSSLVLAVGLAVAGPTAFGAAQQYGADVQSPLVVSNSVVEPAGAPTPAAGPVVYRVVYKRANGQWAKYQDFANIQQAQALVAWLKQHYPLMEFDVWVVQ